jgi:hypothetical protein
MPRKQKNIPVSLPNGWAKKDQATLFAQWGMAAAAR